MQPRKGGNKSICHFKKLKLLAKNCNFGSLVDETIRDRLVCGIISERVKERLLREQELSLDKAMLIRQVEEESNKQIKLLSEEGPETVVQAVKQTPHHGKPIVQSQTSRQRRTARGKSVVMWQLWFCTLQFTMSCSRKEMLSMWTVEPFCSQEQVQKGCHSQ